MIAWKYFLPIRPSHGSTYNWIRIILYTTHYYKYKLSMLWERGEHSTASRLFPWLYINIELLLYHFTDWRIRVSLYCRRKTLVAILRSRNNDEVTSGKNIACKSRRARRHRLGGVHSLRAFNGVAREPDWLLRFFNDHHDDHEVISRTPNGIYYTHN